MTKSTVPVHPLARTARQRKAWAKVQFAADKKTARPTMWGAILRDRPPVHVSVGSKRVNTKSIVAANVVELYHRADTAVIFKLKDGRVCLLMIERWAWGHAFEIPIEPQIWVSHDLEHLWWYAVPEAVRKAFAADAAVIEACDA